MKSTSAPTRAEITARGWKRVGILFDSGHTSRRERYFIAELLNDASAAIDRVAIIAARCELGAADRLMRTVASRLVALAGRMPADSEPIAASADLRVDVITCGASEVRRLVQDENLDALIDFRRVSDAAALSRLVRTGVAQVLCDGRPENLEFDSTFRRTTWHLALAVSIAGAAPRIVMELRQRPTVPALARDRDLLAGRATAFLLRWLRGAAGTSDQEIPSSRVSVGGLRAIVGAVHAVIHHVSSRASRVVEHHDRWFLAHRAVQNIKRDASSSSRLEYHVFEPFRDGFVADPCLFRHRDVDYVFYEEYRFSERRGVISCSTVDVAGQVTPPRRVLTEPYHLSYPYVFEHAGAVYMIPESASNKTVDLYRAAAFPDRWERIATLLEGVNAVDATPYHDGTRWWLFANIGEHGSSTWDELFLFYSETLEGPWRPHAANPVKSDASSSRPAGALWMDDGRLMRPSQDCSIRYGGGIALCHIESLTTTSFRERVIARIPAETFEGCDGFHTITGSNRIEVIDVRWEPRATRNSANRRIVTAAPALSIRSAASPPK